MIKINKAICIGNLSKLAMITLLERLFQPTPQVADAATKDKDDHSSIRRRLVQHRNLLPKANVAYTSNEMDRDRVSFGRHSRDPPLR